MGREAVVDAAMLAVFEKLALAAGRRIMQIRSAGVTAELKPDASPVTEADRAAEKLPTNHLKPPMEPCSVVDSKSCLTTNFWIRELSLVVLRYVGLSNRVSSTPADARQILRSTLLYQPSYTIHSA
jgi:hypothetical protein